MFCNQCGKELPQNAAFCSYCGAPVNGAAGKKPVSEASYQAYDNNFRFEAERPPVPKKKRSKFLIPGISAAIVIVVILVLLLSAGSVKGNLIKLFGSDEKYFAYTEKKSMESYVDTVSTIYGNILEMSEKTSAQGEMKVEIGETAQDLIITQSGIPYDLSFLEDMTLCFESSSDGKNSGITAKLMLGKTELLDLSIINNIENMDTYIGVLNLSSKYLKADGEALGLYPGSENSAMSNMILEVKLKDILPDDKDVNELLKKYIFIVLEEIDAVTTEKTRVSIGGIEQKLTEVTFSMNEKTAYGICKVVLEEAKGDKDLKKLILETVSSFKKEFPEMAAELPEADEVYETFVTGINEYLMEMNAVNLGELSTEPYFQVVDLVNSKHEIVGRKLIADDREILRYVTVQKGKKIAFELTAEGFEIQGSGEKKKDTLNCAYDIMVNGQRIATFNLEDFDTEAFKEGEIDGAIVLKPDTYLYNQIPAEAASLLSAAEFSLRLDMDTDADSGEIDMTLLSKGEKYIKIGSEVDTGKKNVVSIPDESATVDLENADEWLMTLDFNVLIAALEKAEVDPQLIEMINSMLAQLEY